MPHAAGAAPHEGAVGILNIGGLKSKRNCDLIQVAVFSLSKPATDTHPLDAKYMTRLTL